MLALLRAKAQRAAMQGEGRVRGRGFTLLEVTVAFIIAALALGVLFSGAMQGLRGSAVTAGYESALSRARSHLDAASVALAPGTTEGDDGGGYHWRLRIVPLETIRVGGGNGAQSAISSQGTPVTLYDLTVSVSWKSDGRTRDIQLETQRIGVGH
jgi:general secretion pathway protein I